MDLNILQLTYFLILKRRALALFSLTERSLAWYCQLRFVSVSHTQVFRTFSRILVFLTHVGIRQMPTWLPTWKAKSLYHVGTFSPTLFFLPFQKFKTITIKPQKIPYTPPKIFQRYFQIYLLYSLSLANCKLMRKYHSRNWSSLSFMFFFSIEIRSNQFRVYLII